MLLAALAAFLQAIARHVRHRACQKVGLLAGRNWPKPTKREPLASVLQAYPDVGYLLENRKVELLRREGTLTGLATRPV